MEWLTLFMVLIVGLLALWGLHEHHERLITRQGYDYYIQFSSRWKKKRQECFKAFGNRCAYCNSPYNLQAHHRSYRNLYHEKPIRDLVALCRNCHARAPRSKELYKG